LLLEKLNIKTLTKWVDKLNGNGAWTTGLSVQRAKELTRIMKEHMAYYSKWRVEARGYSDSCVTLRAVTAHLLVDLLRTSRSEAQTQDPLVMELSSQFPGSQRELPPLPDQNLDQPDIDVEQAWQELQQEAGRNALTHVPERGQSLKRKPVARGKSVFDQQRDIFHAAIGQLEHAKSVTAQGLQVAEHDPVRRELRQKSSQRLLAIQKNLEGIQRSLSAKQENKNGKKLRIVTNFNGSDPV
jgi:hypothetical protein